MFTCCHPALALEAQIALTLHTLGGLTTHEIARAFLVPEPTMAQRLARARAKIRNAGIPYRVPPIDLLPQRLDALLAVIYLIFNEGYSATSGDEPIRKDLCLEAIRLCRVLIALMPESAETRGLLALMLLHDSRREARLDSTGDLILLSDQDRSRWDRAEIQEGIGILDEALALNNPGPYQVQAAISSLHAEATTAGETDWKQIAALYKTLAMMTQSPVIEINRAVAVGMAEGPQEGLRVLDQLGDRAKNYYPYHVVRADLLRRSGQLEEAIESYQRAIALCDNPAERSHLQRQLDSLIHAGK
jgi:RNA polymerase sigma-70 factor (ECF subfamily)